MQNKVPEYHFIEKENEVVFYIPYDEELLNLYTNEFFALHEQNADIAIIAFHGNDDVMMGGYGESELQIPYKYFHNKAKFVSDELNKRFQNEPTKESSYNLFSALISNVKDSIFAQKPVIPQEPETEYVPEIESVPPKSVLELEPSSPTPESVPYSFPSLFSSFTDTEADKSYESEQYESESLSQSVQDAAEPIQTELTNGNIFQITIEKKTVPSINQKLKIPIDVFLEKEIDYYYDKLPNRQIKHKYGLHGIHMLV
jgi:hypothetical protein